MAILILAEHDNQNLSSNIAPLITAAQELDEDLHVLVAGYNCAAVIQQAIKLSKVKLCLHADHACYQHQLAENIAALVHSVATDYNYILAPASTFGKNILPRVAGLLDTEQISEVIAIISKDTFVRPIYAGNAIATVQSSDLKKLLTIRPTAFAACASDNTQCQLKTIDLIFDLQLSSFINRENQAASSRPELTTARIVVSGGRGLKSKENFALIENLANTLHAAVGASRAAVDAGYVTNDYQVGQTGKIVAPDLYFAIGISGAIQHIAGMKDSKVIVAINIDPEAPIFKIADYGLVADLFKAVPELIQALSS
jgi:electron transfer flavoprotein alpha subunit